MLKANFIAALIAFFVPVIFVTNLFGVIGEFGWGFVNYHSYLTITGLFLYLILLAGSSRYVVTKEVFLFIIFYSIFMFTCLLSLLLVANQSDSIDEFTGYAWMCIFSIGFVFSFKYEGMLKATTYGALIAVLLMSFFNIYEFVDSDFRVFENAVGANDDVVVGRANRIAGLHSDQNASAYAIIFSIFVISYYLKKNFMLLLAVLSFFPIIATFSRSGIVLWAVTVVYIGITRDDGRFSTIGALTSIIFLCLVTYLIVSGQLIELIINAGYGDSLNKDMANRLSGNIFGQTDGSSEERRDLVANAIDAFISNPITGIGLGVFGSDDILGNSAHNMFLQLGAELGLMGLVTYCYLFAIPVILKSWFGFKFATLAMFVSLFSHTVLWEPWFLYCTAMCLVIIPMQTRIAKEEIRHRKVTTRKRKKKRRVRRSHSARQTTQ